ncbi:hypothetical protein L6164_006519 [Bauhinia variegata]|uniref:Uncharacterized protein n=1 Tax=Bauhinia variegata TaxID=167791 RepID=A0ACB9PWI4_BAUVA|nr:hypothetical protein L6164_006519 [Bauhinia variegata]
MVHVQASKLTLPNPSLSSPHITSILFESNSLSLALMHSDSSFSLYPSFSPISSSLPSPQMQIPSPSSSSTFLLLQSSNPDSTSRVLFVVSGPHRAGSEVLLRFYILQKSKLFARAQVVCTQKDLRFEQKLGVLVNVKHGVSIKLAGSINYFAMHSVSSSKIWVFAVKMEADDEGDDSVIVKLMRCAVIECEKPVWSVSISFGFLLLGEENGVRVFSLRRLVKGRVKKVKNSKIEGRGLPLPNGVIANDSGKHAVRVRGGKQYGVEGISEVICNVDVEGKVEKHLSVKPTHVRFRQDDKDGGACFVVMKRINVETKSMRKVLTSVKAISIQALSQRMFLILDSAGDLHLLCLSSSGIGSDIVGHIRQLPHIIQVQNLAVLPDSSKKSQTVWISDGYQSVHMLATMDTDYALNAPDGSDGDEKLLPLQGVSIVIEVLFSSEKIQDVISLASNAILILGQGSLYAYAIS